MKHKKINKENIAQCLSAFFCIQKYYILKFKFK